MAAKTERLNLRLTPSQDVVLRRAAEVSGESLSDFVLRHAVLAAEMGLADRRTFVLGETAWRELQKELKRSPRPSPRLRKLLSEPSVLERQ
ncbi:MAG: DUF1778 domain-containing protein [Actinomycetota bacterium]